MAVNGHFEKWEKYRQISTPSDEDYFTERGFLKIELPETQVPTFAAQVPELRNATSYWQIGTASLSRVKINALRSDVTIRTDQATSIMGMASELWEPVDTLGTAIVHIFDVPVEVHVTRSKQCAPIVADGILGYDFLFQFPFTLYGKARKGQMIFSETNVVVPVAPAKELRDDYMDLLRRKLVENTVAHKRGPWSVVSKALQKLRPFLPLQVTQDDRLAVIETLEEYADRFHKLGDKLGVTPLIVYSIKTKDPEVVNREQPELSPEQWDEIERQVDVLLEQGVIRASTSPYNFPVTLIEKKPSSRGAANPRLAVDFRELNNRSHGDAFPIPDIIDLVDQLHGARYFTVLDLASASYQIALDPKDCKRTAFTTRRGRYEFLRMPAGIKNASQYLQRLMHEVLDGMLGSGVAFVCHDDIIIHAATLAEHEVRVRRVLARLRDAGLKLQPDKCQLFRTTVNYLGYRVTDKGLRPDSDKIQKLKDHPLPESTRSLSSYLGLLGHFKRFIPNYAARAKGMANLLATRSNDRSLVWSDEARQSFDDLKEALSEDWLLRYPDWDREFILETSSSALGIQAALKQRLSDGAKPTPIAYASRCYRPAEAKEGRCNQDCLAAIYGMETFYWYLEDYDGKKFTLMTPEPKAFDWYLQRKLHVSEILARFELAYAGKRFTIERLSTVK